MRDDSRDHSCARECSPILPNHRNGMTYATVRVNCKRHQKKLYFDKNAYAAKMHFMAKICFHIYNATKFISKEIKFFVSGKNSYFPSIFDAIGHFIELYVVFVLPLQRS